MIIALTAPKQSGKTVLADYLVEKHGFIKINFKDALIHEIKANFPRLLKEISRIKDYDIKNDLFESKPTVVRCLLQEYGTEVRRNDDHDYWVKKWNRMVNTFVLRGGDVNIVVDDCRFDNEAMAVHKHRGAIIRIERPDVENTDTHASETEQADIHTDYHIVNDTTKENLYASFEDIYKQIKSKENDK